MINVIARSEIKPGCMEKYMQVLKANVPTVLAEEGCIRYEPCVDVNAGIGPEVKGDSGELGVGGPSARPSRDEAHGRFPRSGRFAARREYDQRGDSRVRGKPTSKEPFRRNSPERLFFA